MSCLEYTNRTSSGLSGHFMLQPGTQLLLRSEEERAERPAPDVAQQEPSCSWDRVSRGKEGTRHSEVRVCCDFPSVFILSVCSS